MKIPGGTSRPRRRVPRPSCPRTRKRGPPGPFPGCSRARSGARGGPCRPPLPSGPAHRPPRSRCRAAEPGSRRPRPRSASGPRSGCAGSARASPRRSGARGGNASPRPLPWAWKAFPRSARAASASPPWTRGTCTPRRWCRSRSSAPSPRSRAACGARCGWRRSPWRTRCRDPLPRARSSRAPAPAPAPCPCASADRGSSNRTPWCGGRG